jgi:hypothetical protein
MEDEMHCSFKNSTLQKWYNQAKTVRDMCRQQSAGLNVFEFSQARAPIRNPTSVSLALVSTVILSVIEIYPIQFGKLIKK